MNAHKEITNNQQGIYGQHRYRLHSNVYKI